jgi:GH24 family phage-related lysozyme (muramidase)
MYLDTHNPPLVTVGTGNMLPNAGAAQALPFVNAGTGKRATKEEIAVAYHKVAAMRGGLRPPSRYIQEPNIEITEEEAKQLAFARLKKEFIPGLRRWVKGFDHVPVPAREALIDMAYNGGVGHEARIVNGERHKSTGIHGFTHLKHAVETGAWQMAARVCHSSSSRPERNAWRSKLFERAARVSVMSTVTPR